MFDRPDESTPDDAQSLDEGMLLTLELKHPAELRVRRGLVWVTRSGDPRDHVLAAGQGIRFPGRGRVVIEALAPATIALRRARADAPGLCRMTADPRPKVQV